MTDLSIGGGLHVTEPSAGSLFAEALGQTGDSDGSHRYLDPESHLARLGHPTCTVRGAVAPPSALPGGPLGLPWSVDADRYAAPHGPLWITLDAGRAGSWWWRVTDSWERRTLCTGVALDLRRAMVTAELAALCALWPLSAAISVRSAIAFGDWPQAVPA